MMSPFPFLLFESDEKKNIATQKQDSKKDRIIHYILFSNICVRWVFCPLAPWLFRLNQGFRQAPPPQSLQWYHWGTQHLKAPTRFPPIEIHIWRKTEKPTLKKKKIYNIYLYHVHTTYIPLTKNKTHLWSRKIIASVSQLQGWKESIGTHQAMAEGCKLKNVGAKEFRNLILLVPENIIFWKTCFFHFGDG